MDETRWNVLYLYKRKEQFYENSINKRKKITDQILESIDKKNRSLGKIIFDYKCVDDCSDVVPSSDVYKYSYNFSFSSR